MGSVQQVVLPLGVQHEHITPGRLISGEIVVS